MDGHIGTLGIGGGRSPMVRCIRGMEGPSGPPLSSRCCIYKLDLEALFKTVKEWEEETRACYAENIELSSEDFAKMILLDGIYIFELFLRNYAGDLREDSDRILIFDPGFFNAINHDLILLENQLPFFVLERIFDLSSQQIPRGIFSTMLHLTFDFFSDYNTQKKQPNFEVIHLLDLVRIFQLPSNPITKRNTDEEFKFQHSATDLFRAGVKFKVASSGCLLDMHFKNNILEIPCLTLYAKTESYIRNLMVFEQCHHPYDSPILDFFFF
ncbi:Protein of unknown function DUF247, plant [Dillenia turbinata]|uniref:Uncharacterized protein n=1 Tax=Dillenia turbinata TaxID=194707 RepID=A0AAN8Z782_9MAGN